MIILIHLTFIHFSMPNKVFTSAIFIPYDHFHFNTFIHDNLCVIILHDYIQLVSTKCWRRAGAENCSPQKCEACHQVEPYLQETRDKSVDGDAIPITTSMNEGIERHTSQLQNLPPPPPSWTRQTPNRSWRCGGHCACASAPWWRAQFQGKPKQVRTCFSDESESSSATPQVLSQSEEWGYLELLQIIVSSSRNPRPS